MTDLVYGRPIKFRRTEPPPQSDKFLSAMKARWSHGKEHYQTSLSVLQIEYTMFTNSQTNLHHSNIEAQVPLPLKDWPLHNSKCGPCTFQGQPQGDRTHRLIFQ